MSCVKKRRQLLLIFAQCDISNEQQASSVERQMNDFKRTAVHRSLTVKDLDQDELESSSSARERDFLKS